MDPHATGAIVGATIAGVVALLSGWLSQKHEKERAEEAWAREVQRTESEWFREKVLEAYSGCVYYSIKLGISAAVKSAAHSDEVRQHYSEAHRYLLLLRAYSTDEAVIEQLTACSNDLDANWDKAPDLARVADKMAIRVGQLLKQDLRVKAQPGAALAPARIIGSGS